jgi:hypothetical protein
MVSLLEPERAASTSSYLRLFWKQLPVPLRLLLCVYIANIIYLVGFSSNHFVQDDYLLMMLPSAQRSLRTTSDPGRNALEVENAFDHDNVLVVIISDRLEGIIPTVSSILTHTTSKPVDLVLIGNNPVVNERVQQHFMNAATTSTASEQQPLQSNTTRAAIHQFTSLTVADVQADLQSQGYQPIWTRLVRSTAYVARGGMGSVGDTRTRIEPLAVLFTSCIAVPESSILVLFR